MTSVSIGASAAALASVLAGALLTVACLGHGTARVDAPCREMRAAVAFEMLKDNPTIPILDVRRASEIGEGEGRLANSIQIPLDGLDGRMAELQRFHDTTVVVLGADGEGGRRACQLLSARGFKYVVFVSDGAAGWYKHGLPMLPAAAPAPATAPKSPDVSRRPV